MKSRRSSRENGPGERLEVPREIRQLVGEGTKPKELESFWNTPSRLLGDKSPGRLWRSGAKDRELVRNYILSGLSGDMA